MPYVDENIKLNADQTAIVKQFSFGLQMIGTKYEVLDSLVRHAMGSKAPESSGRYLNKSLDEALTAAVGGRTGYEANKPADAPVANGEDKTADQPAAAAPAAKAKGKGKAKTPELTPDEIQTAAKAKAATATTVKGKAKAKDAGKDKEPETAKPASPAAEIKGAKLDNAGRREGGKKEKKVKQPKPKQDIRYLRADRVMVKEIQPLSGKVKMTLQQVSTLVSAGGKNMSTATAGHCKDSFESAITVLRELKVNNLKAFDAIFNVKVSKDNSAA